MRQTLLCRARRSSQWSHPSWPAVVSLAACSFLDLLCCHQLRLVHCSAWWSQSTSSTRPGSQSPIEPCSRWCPFYALYSCTSRWPIETAHQMSQHHQRGESGSSLNFPLRQQELDRDADDYFNRHCHRRLGSHVHSASLSCACYFDLYHHQRVKLVRRLQAGQGIRCALKGGHEM